MAVWTDPAAVEVRVTAVTDPTLPHHLTFLAHVGRDEAAITYVDGAGHLTHVTVRRYYRDVPSLWGAVRGLLTKVFADPAHHAAVPYTREERRRVWEAARAAVRKVETEQRDQARTAQLTYLYEVKSLVRALQRPDAVKAWVSGNACLPPTMRAALYAHALYDYTAVGLDDAVEAAVAAFPV